MPHKRFQIFLVILTILWMGSCQEYVPDVIVKSIPEEDRFFSNTGDYLFYSCSDGSMDTLMVKRVDFYTHSFSEEDWLGILWNYKIDHYKVSLEIADTSWLRILHYACYDPADCNSCVNIETDAFEEEKPTTKAYFSCEEYGGLVFATGAQAVSKLYLNDRFYHNVYSWNLEVVE